MCLQCRCATCRHQYQYHYQFWEENQTQAEVSFIGFYPTAPCCLLLGKMFRVSLPKDADICIIFLNPGAHQETFSESTGTSEAEIHFTHTVCSLPQKEHSGVHVMTSSCRVLLLLLFCFHIWDIFPHFLPVVNEGAWHVRHSYFQRTFGLLRNGINLQSLQTLFLQVYPSEKKKLKYI